VRSIAAVLALLIPAAAGAVPQMLVSGDSCGISLFRQTEGASNVTTTTAVIYATPVAALDIRVKYRASGTGAWTTTGTTAATAETKAEIGLTSLTAGQLYDYVVECRPTGSGAPWGERPQGRFRTLYSSATVASFMDVVTADPHGWARYSATNEESCGTAKSVDPDETDRTHAKIASLQPAHWIELGDQRHSHCNACNETCSVYGRTIDTGSSLSTDDATARSWWTMEVAAMARRMTNYVPKVGNHEARLFGMDITFPGACGHDSQIGQISEDAWQATFPNPNDAFPHGIDGDRGHFWHERSGQVSYLYLDEYVYTCNSDPGCPSGLPNDPDDWKLGASQVSWMQGLTASLGDVVIVGMHHVPGGINMNTCYTYGRFGPLATTDGAIDSDWRGDLQEMQDYFETLVGLGKTVVVLLGHDHRFGYGGTKNGVHYFLVGQPGNTTTAWADGGNAGYNSGWDVDGDGTADHLQYDTEYYAPQPNDPDYAGYVTLEYNSSNSDQVILRWWTTDLDDTYNGQNRWIYTLEGSSVQVVRP